MADATCNIELSETDDLYFSRLVDAVADSGGNLAVCGEVT